MIVAIQGQELACMSLLPQSKSLEVIDIMERVIYIWNYVCTFTWIIC